MMKRRELSKKRRQALLHARPTAVLARWRRMVAVLVNEVGDLFSLVRVFREFVEVVRANPTTLHPPVFFNWARDNYVLAICLGLRRLLDVDDDVMSLGCLLRELELRPAIVTRNSHHAVSRRHGISGRDADATFDCLIGQGATSLTTRTLTREIAALERAERRIRRLVNKRFAHRAPLAQQPRRPLTFQEIEAVLYAADRLVCRYDALLRAGGLTTAFPYSTDWRRVFWMPWIPTGARARLPQYMGPITPMSP